jgi:hypothetical protein
MPVGGGIGTGQRLRPDEGKAFAQGVAADHFQIQPVGSRILGVFLEHADLLRPVADADMAGRQEFGILSQQLVQLASDRAGAVGERQLRQVARLTADVAEVDAAGLLADQAAFQQDDRAGRPSGRGGAGKRRRPRP